MYNAQQWIALGELDLSMVQKSVVADWAFAGLARPIHPLDEPCIQLMNV